MPHRIPACDASTPGIALLPLRLFLGATFVYAGVEVPRHLPDGVATVGSASELLTDALDGVRGGTRIPRE